MRGKDESDMLTEFKVAAGIDQIELKTGGSYDTTQPAESDDDDRDEPYMSGRERGGDGFHEEDKDESSADSHRIFTPESAVSIGSTILSEHAIHLDGVAVGWDGYKDDANNSLCKRCLIDNPDAAARIEDLEHAFHHCSSVSSLWDLARGWIKALCPSTELSGGGVDEDIFCCHRRTSFRQSPPTSTRRCFTTFGAPKVHTSYNPPTKRAVKWTEVMKDAN
ncbi:hypothetical protein DFQ26_001397 [Actinomortierella ambigua]|nr:hypothetical protein DFQ26_001397 [Actinomortierella ambigua]